MARDRDDDALSWGDEEDPTYVAAHPATLDEDDLEEDVPVVDAFSSSASAPPLPPQAPAAPAAPTTSAANAAAAADTTAAATTASAPAALLSTDTIIPPSVPSAAPAAPAPTAAATTTLPMTTLPMTTLPMTTLPMTTAPTLGQDAEEGEKAEVVEAADAAAAERDLADAETESEQLSSAALILFGVFGGVFLLYTVGWLVTFIRTPVADASLAGIVQNAQGVLAIAAPALWFIVTLLVGSKRRVPVRVVWLLIGVVVLAPWPFLTGY